MRSAAPPRHAPPTAATDDFNYGLKASVIAHAALIVTAIVSSLVFPKSSTLPLAPTLRVDLVGLPDILKKDLKNAPKPNAGLEEALKKAEEAAKNLKPTVVPKAPVEKAAPEEMVLKPKPAPQDAGKDDKARESRIKNALARMKALSKLQNEAPAAMPIKGNAISKGTSLSGDAREAAEASYHDTIRDRLSDNWALPVWLSRQQLSARVVVYIDAQGRLKNFRFDKMSGNAQFDEAVKRTLQQSGPFPAPPADLAREVLLVGIPFAFPL